MPDSKTFIGYFRSPLGWLEIKSNNTQILAVQFTSKKNKITFLPKVLKNCLKQLVEYFAGRRKKFDLPLHLTGTKFQSQVWQALQKIPYGKTVCYAEIARKIKKPLAVRAVGQANNKNKLAIIVPCHRVIGKDQSLVGYAAGLSKKKWLLDFEKNIKN